MKLLAPDHLPADQRQKLMSLPGVSVSWLNISTTSSFMRRVLNAGLKRLLTYRMHTRARPHLEADTARMLVDGVPLESRSDWNFDSLLATWIFDERIARRVLSRLPELKWIHSTVTGVDHLDVADLARRQIELTGPRGVHSARIAEFVIGLVYSDLKNVPEHLEASRVRRARFLASRQCADTTVGILGYGAIGKAVARLAVANGMDVMAYQRRETLPDNPAVQTTRDLRDLLVASDFLVLALPKTPATVGLLGREELAALRPGATIINVGRSECVCESALREALHSHRLRRAYLDVVADEMTGRPTFAPPRKHPLYQHRNLVFTGYSASESTHTSHELFSRFISVLEGRLHGRPAQHTVDLNAGY